MGMESAGHISRTRVQLGRGFSFTIVIAYWVCVLVGDDYFLGSVWVFGDLKT